MRARPIVGFARGGREQIDALFAERKSDLVTAECCRAIDAHELEMPVRASHSVLPLAPVSERLDGQLAHSRLDESGQRDVWIGPASITAPLRQDQHPAC
jgi:hypothetical protein